jgi:hypothetical protein
MSWANILKKNNKQFETEKIVQSQLDTTEESEVIDDNIKDLDEEFENKYMMNIVDIKCDLKEYIESQSLPFLNKTNINIYHNFYEFIKNNCTNLHELENKLNKEYETYLEEIQKEEEEYYYECLSEFDD